MPNTVHRVPQSLAVVLMPGFSAIAFFAALEPLRIANRLSGKTLFAWTIHAPSGDDAAASNGMMLRCDGALPDAPHTLVVCAGFDPLHHAQPSLLGQIRRLWRAGCHIGSVDTGAFVLAEAGILGQEMITLHWEAAEEFRRRYPRIPVSTELYERHARLMTCAGGTAAMDMMLDGIAASHGIALAQAVSDQLIHDRIRPASAPQRTLPDLHSNRASPLVQRLVTAMDQGRATGQPLAAILAATGLNRRQAERLCQAELGMTPGRFYRSLRLRHALDLMRQTGMPVHEAASAAGFSSQPVFSRACRQHFGLSPRAFLAGAEGNWAVRPPEP
jgi:AraC family carnitine catabolism transcriptional activator